MPSCFCPTDSPGEHPHIGPGAPDPAPGADHGDHVDAPDDAPDDVLDAVLGEVEPFTFAPLLVVRDPADLWATAPREMHDYLGTLQDGIDTFGGLPRVLYVPRALASLQFEVVR